MQKATPSAVRSRLALGVIDRGPAARGGPARWLTVHLG